jgi:hypothetical protein
MIENPVVSDGGNSRQGDGVLRGRETGRHLLPTWSTLRRP